MRKRAQRKSPVTEMIQKPIKPIAGMKNKFFKKKKINYWIAISLILVFCLVLFFNTYFNLSSGMAINPEATTVSEKFYLSGPDPYYNMRLVEGTLETGRYPYYSAEDPILNYPLGRSGGRAPLLNMMAIGFSKLLVPFVGDVDAIGYSMQFIPALFGALLIFPVYFIGKTLFGKKEGLVAALLVAVIPIHIGSGHGSAYTLFDHDSFNLLLFFLTFLFLIKSVKEKNNITSALYAGLAGTSVAALTLVWVEAQFIYVVIAAYAFIQIFIDIIRNKISLNFARNMSIILLLGYFVSLPVRITRLPSFSIEIPLVMGFAILIFGLFTYILHKKKIPWILSLPVIIGAGIFLLAFFYIVPSLATTYSFLSPLSRISEVIYGSGIYGTKVDITIAEAGTYSISRTVMSYGPALYWLAWAGLVLLIFHYITQKGRREYMFIIVLFIINIWLAGSAGRFLNDMVPLIAVLAGWITWFVIDKLNYKEMLRNIRNAGGGLRGIRKGTKIYHLLGIFFVAFIVIMPNAFLALDAAIPSAVTQNGTSNLKIDFFGIDHESAFGSSTYKEQYWIDAFSWLRSQDNDIKDPTDRPAFISWWDYGFYASAVSEHPTVADNFQDGIPPAANFHTSKSEKEAVSVWIVRLLEGNNKQNGNSLSPEVNIVLKKYLNITSANNISQWLSDPTRSPSYLAPIGEEYDKNLSKELLVGEQYIENAYYHDIVNLLNATLDEESITWLYHDLQEATGYSIRYYGVEGYDTQIFNIFGFLGDKSLFLHANRKIKYIPMLAADLKYNSEDDFIRATYTIQSSVYPNTDEPRYPTLDGTDMTFEEIQALSQDQKKGIYIVDIKTELKEGYSNTIFYRTYIGDIPEELQQISQLPCWGLRHFTADFVSAYPYYGAGRSAVVIAKYYEGATINGSITYEGAPLDAQAVIRKDTSLFGTTFLIDHDTNVSTNGAFELIAPAGNITLELRKNTELGLNAFILKTITFNSTMDAELAPITDDEAMRLNGTNYQRTLNITIEPATFEGYIYINNDNDTSTYNESIDEPLQDVDITLSEVAEFENDVPKTWGPIQTLTTDENGYFNATDLMPGIYFLRAVQDDFVLHENYVFIYSDNNSYNISRPELASVEGTIYFDTNENDQYNSGEEMEGSDLELLYTTLDGTSKLVSTATTSSSGTYSFTNLIPGEYIINATKTNSTTGYYDYAIEEPLSLAENDSLTVNISITYAPITVSGLTTYNGQNIADISIEFLPNELIEDNTAEGLTVLSDEVGQYEAEVLPGSYNITIDEIGDGEKGWYTYKGQVTLLKGQGVQTLDMGMSKTSITVTGNTLYNSASIANITITFDPDPETTNNTAIFGTAQSDESGKYTAELLPGTYVVTVDELVSEEGVNVTYLFEGTLIVQSDDTLISYDIAMTRETE